MNRFERRVSCGCICLPTGASPIRTCKLVFHGVFCLTNTSNLIFQYIRNLIFGPATLVDFFFMDSLKLMVSCLTDLVLYFLLYFFLFFWGGVVFYVETEHISFISDPFHRVITLVCHGLFELHSLRCYASRF